MDDGQRKERVGVGEEERVGVGWGRRVGTAGWARGREEEGGGRRGKGRRGVVVVRGFEGPNCATNGTGL